MSEPTQLTAEQIAAIQAENETLRRTNAELVEKSGKRKNRVEELEVQLAKTNDELYQMHVGAPLRGMAESVSNAPELWVEQFSKHYKLEMQDGKLTILSVADGKPVNVDFTRDALVKFLTDEAHPQAKTFRAITVTSRASGAGGIGPRASQGKQEATPKIHFGLR